MSPGPSVFSRRGFEGPIAGLAPGAGSMAGVEMRTALANSGSAAVKRTQSLAVAARRRARGRYRFGRSQSARATETAVRVCPAGPPLTAAKTFRTPR